MIYYHKDSKFLLKPHKKEFFQNSSCPNFCVRVCQIWCIAQKYSTSPFYRQSAVVTVYCKNAFLRQSVSDMVHRAKSPAMDSTWKYSHCWAFRDVPYVAHYHAKINYIFLPTLVRLAPLAAEALAAVFLGVAVLATFLSSPSSVLFLRERRVLGLASAGAAAVGATPVV